MKKLLYLFLILPLLVACGSDDDDNDKTEVIKTTGFTKEDVVGTWKISGLSAPDSEYFTQYDNGTALIFNSNETATIMTKNQTTGDITSISGTYTVSANTITIASDEIYVNTITKKIGNNTIHLIVDRKISPTGFKFKFTKQ